MYKQYEALFDSRIASVNGLDGALAVAEAPTQRNQAQTRFDFATAPIDSALDEWRKKTELDDRLGAGGTLIGRPDLALAQKKKIMEVFLASIRVAAKQVPAYVADDLIWYATKGGLDESSIRPAVELLVRSIPHSPGYVIAMVSAFRAMWPMMRPCCLWRTSDLWMSSGRRGRAKSAKARKKYSRWELPRG